MPKRHFSPYWIACLCLIAYGTPPAQSRQPDAARAPVTWVIFVDDLHLDFRNTGFLRNMMKKIVEELIREGDRFAIASSGPSTIAIDVTADRELLAAAIKKTTGNALKYEDIIAAGSLDEVRYRASIALATVQSLLNNASRAPSGPKALIYISNGYSSEVLKPLAELTATATQSGVRIFAIDPRAAFDDPFPVPNDPAWQAHVLARQAVLRSISDGGNGFAIVDGDFVTQLRRIADTMNK